MLGFKPLIFGVGSDRSANCTTATALEETKNFMKKMF